MQGTKFDTESLRLLTLFEKTMHASVKDCITDSSRNCIYFIVQEGQAGVAIGRNGSNVRHVKDLIKKDVKVFEFSSDLKTFVKNLIPQANDVEVKDSGGEKIVEVKVDNGDKPIVIGRDKRNIKLFKELLRRNHDVSDIIVR